MYRVYSLSNELLYEGHDETTAKAAMEASEQPAAMWTLIGVSAMNYQHLNDAQLRLLQEIATKTPAGTVDAAIKHSKGCIHCLHSLHRAA